MASSNFNLYAGSSSNENDFETGFEKLYNNVLGIEEIPVSENTTSYDRTEEYGADSEYAVNNDLEDDLSDKYIENENITDPHVICDPINLYAKAIDVYMFQDEDTIPEIGERRQLESRQRTRGIVYPLLNIMTEQIDDSKIKFFKLESTDFLPTLTVVLDNSDNKFTTQIYASKNSTCTAMILHGTDGVYRKIALEFSIDTCTTEDSFVKFNCTFKCPELAETQYNSVGDHELTTFELCQEIALQTGLGFQCTDDLYNILDPEKRIIPNETYPKYLEDQIKKGGRDSSELFEAWIDLYGYITVINKEYVFNNPSISPENLTIWALTGFESGSVDLPEQKYKKVHRTLTDIREANTQSNLEIYTFRRKSDTTTPTLTQLSIFDRATNLLDRIDIAPKPLTFDDTNMNWMSANIEVKSPVVKTTNFNGTIQLETNKIWRINREQNILIVTLKYPNLGLQRGTLVTIAHYASGEDEKAAILNSMRSNIIEAEGIEMANQVLSDSIKSEIIKNPNSQVIDPALSGLYYIDKMEFVYNADFDSQINQVLYLFTVGEIKKLLNETEIRIPSEISSNSEIGEGKDTATDEAIEQKDGENKYVKTTFKYYVNGKEVIKEGVQKVPIDGGELPEVTIVAKKNDNLRNAITPVEQQSTSDQTNSALSDEERKRQDEQKMKKYQEDLAVSARQGDEAGMMDPGDFDGFDLDGDLLGYYNKMRPYKERDSISENDALQEIFLDDITVYGNANKNIYSRPIVPTIDSQINDALANLPNFKV